MPRTLNAGFRDASQLIVVFGRRCLIAWRFPAMPSFPREDLATGCLSREGAVWAAQHPPATGCQKFLPLAQMPFRAEQETSSFPSSASLRPLESLQRVPVGALAPPFLQPSKGRDGRGLKR